MPAMLLFGIHASDDNRGGAGDVCKRLAEAAQGKHAAGQRIERVDQNDIFVTPEADMLETVVQQEDAGVEGLFQLPARFEPVRSDADMGAARAHEDLRLVAGLIEGSASRRAERRRCRWICGDSRA